MSLLAGVNYYFISDSDLNDFADYDDEILADAGLHITASGVEALIADFRSGVNIGGVWYVGEDHIDADERAFLDAAGFLNIYEMMDSAQQPGNM